MGNSSSRQVSALNDFVTNVTFDTIININNACRTSVNAGQTMDINIGAPQESIDKCIARGWSPSDCSALFTSGTNVSNIQQAFQIELDSACQLEQEDVTKLQNDIAAKLEAKAQQQNDEVGSTLKTLMTILGGETKDDLDIRNRIETTIKNTFTKDTVNEMITAYTGEQGIQIMVGFARDTTVRDIKQELKAKVVADMVNKNTSLSEAVNTLDVQLTNEGQQVNRGLTSIIDTIGSTIGGIAGDITDTWKVAIIGVAVLCCCLIIFLPAIFMSFGQSGMSRNFSGVANRAMQARMNPLTGLT
jgi:hypothetical protein